MGDCCEHAAEQDKYTQFDLKPGVLCHDQHWWEGPSF